MAEQKTQTRKKRIKSKEDNEKRKVEGTRK